MIRAYNELYLNDAKYLLADYFDILINDLNIDADHAAELLLITGYAEQIERGNPMVLSGMSGQELAEEVIHIVSPQQVLPEIGIRIDRTPEYWAGWVLAEFQWFSGKRFDDIFSVIPFSEIISLYSPYHEMDIRSLIEELNRRYSEAHRSSKLKQIRERRGLSQSELAELSGVGLRSIQMYEQQVNDIDKAQAHTLYKLSRILGCSVEDLLQDPMK